MKWICFLTLLVLVISCEKNTGSPQSFSIALKECKQQTINDETAQLCFDSLEDSRCPANANCVWQGAARCSFILKTKEQTISFALSTLTLPPLYRKDTVISGYKISLKNVYPYPGTTPEPVRAELVVMKQ